DCGLIGPVKTNELNINFSCNNKCKREILPADQLKISSSYFCYIRLKDYLQYLLPQIYNFLRFDLSETPSEICDLVDGSEYRRLANNNTLVIYFGFDGATYTSNGEKSMWPLVIYICELSFDLRMKYAFPIAIHSGDSQPS